MSENTYNRDIQVTYNFNLTHATRVREPNSTMKLSVMKKGLGIQVWPKETLSVPEHQACKCPGLTQELLLGVLGPQAWTSETGPAPEKATTKRCWKLRRLSCLWCALMRKFPPPISGKISNHLLILLYSLSLSCQNQESATSTQFENLRPGRPWPLWEEMGKGLGSHLRIQRQWEVELVKDQP